MDFTKITQPSAKTQRRVFDKPVWSDPPKKANVAQIPKKNVNASCNRKIRTPSASQPAMHRA